MSTIKTWQETLADSTKKAEQGAKYKKRAGILLWDGAQEAIGEWRDSAADSDETGERLYADVLAALGERRKGDTSKIKTVALAVVNNGLVLANYDNLSKAYAEATRLTKTVKVHAAEDEAADKAVQNISAPKSSSTPEGAALIVLSKGVDEAARLLLAALGTTEHAAHRALIRALTQEVSGLIPKPEPKPKREPKPKGAAKKAAAPKPGAAKPKAAAAKPKGKPVKKTEAPEVTEPTVEEPVDMFADLDDDAPEVETVVEETVAPAKPKGKPVRRGPVRR